MLANIRATSWSDIARQTRSLTLWGFRGQSDKDWKLESTLARSAERCNCDRSLLYHREYWMLRQFERRAFDYIRDSHLPRTKLDWLALMQHHGSPTRLLDFSHSFYVAAFFAMENALSDAAVWAINQEFLGEKIARLMEVDTSHENIDELNARHAGFLEQYLGSRVEHKIPTNLVVPVEPDQLHRRLTMQQGFFLCPTNLNIPFEANLMMTLGKEPDTEIPSEVMEWEDFESAADNYGAIRIVLPREIHREALHDLHKMNVTAATLFPGLDGFARSMNHHIRVMGD